MLWTIKTQDQAKFEREVNRFLEKGFKLSSSSCNTFQYINYPEETYWSAILIKEGD